MMNGSNFFIRPTPILARSLSCVYRKIISKYLKAVKEVEAIFITRVIYVDPVCRMAAIFSFVQIFYVSRAFVDWKTFWK